MTNIQIILKSSATRASLITKQAPEESKEDGDLGIGGLLQTLGANKLASSFRAELQQGYVIAQQLDAKAKEKSAAAA